ncbi:MAG: 5-(carboxyamino)imidazole ribonucleotide synthase [Pseudomonadota bacterium]
MSSNASEADSAGAGDMVVKPVQTVGIIGDGQLGMMLCQAANHLPVKTVLLTTDPSNPAAQAAESALVGEMSDAECIEELVRCCDIITYEREDIPATAIAVLRAAEQRGVVECFPSLTVIELIQDKGRQKTWLAEERIATLPFVLSDGDPNDAHRAAQQLGFPLVQKALRGGFDGRGVQVLRDEAALMRAWPGETLYEEYAGQFREVAVLLVRDRLGNTCAYGPVAMTFEEDYSVLDTVLAPADLGSEATESARALARHAIEAMDGVGTFGVEMFLLASGELLINEISPRVHNAGHYTIEACDSSQFEQHLRAVSGMKLADNQQHTPAAMRNLLCTPALAQESRMRSAQVSSAGPLSEHWYGKTPTRKMRKLGHITALGETTKEAMQRADARWEQIQRTALEANS